MNPHLQHPPVLAGAPLSEARLAAVLVHGRDQGPEVMLDVVQRLELPGVGYVLPVADGGSWYPGRYFDPVSNNEPHVSWSVEALDRAINIAITAGFGPGRIVLGGFSQGACVVAELVARRPRALAGVAVLTGALLGSVQDQVRPATVRGLRMYFGISRYDEWIALEQAEATARAFETAGAHVTLEVYDDREHHVSDRAVAGLKGLFARA
jgi:phospholipase/carboxylesterase